VFSIRKNDTLTAPVDLSAGISHSPYKEKSAFPESRRYNGGGFCKASKTLLIALDKERRRPESHAQ
jgi:hypothetical protein